VKLNHAAAVSLATLGVLGAVAYYLEVRSRRQLHAAVIDAFKIGGWLTGFYPLAPTDAKARNLTPPGKYQDPTKEV
jgi:hypothetical protein